MLKKNFKIRARVWLWPGDGGWHFITLNKKLSADIRKVYPKGFVRIEAHLGQSVFQTSLFPHKLSQAYLVCINKKIRKKEGIFAGDEIQLAFKII